MDLSTDSSLVIDISDALSEKDKVKFTVHTKVQWNYLVNMMTAFIVLANVVEILLYHCVLWNNLLVYNTLLLHGRLCMLM